MRRYSSFSALWRASAFQKSFYQDLAQNGRGIGLFYLLGLLLITWFIALIPPAVKLNTFVKNSAPAMFKDFPTIHIDQAKGIATSDCPQPYIFQLDGEPAFVFDTTGTIKTPSDAHAKLLMTSTELIQEDQPGNVQRHSLKDFPFDILSSDVILSKLTLAKTWFLPATTLLATLWSLAWRLVFALLFALLGLALRRAFHGGMTYGTLLRLAIISMTLPILLDTILWLCQIPFTCGIIWFVLQLLSFGTFTLALRAASQVIPQKPLPPGTFPSTPGSFPAAPGTFPPPPLPPKNPGEDLFP